jgi:hypothetical protein
MKKTPFAPDYHVVRRRQIAGVGSGTISAVDSLAGLFQRPADEVT